MKFQNPKTKNKVTIINIVILIIFITSFIFIYLNIPAFGKSDEFILLFSLIILKQIRDIRISLNKVINENKK